MTMTISNKIKKDVSSVTSRVPGFYKLPIEDRLAFLASSFDLSEEQLSGIRDGSALDIDHAVNMVENGVGILGMPLGLGLNFLVDGKEHIAPMAIEEPSVIAASSKAAMIIRNGGGFNTEIDDPVMIGQVQVLDIEDPEEAADKVKSHKQEILDEANKVNERMIERGGGVFDLETRILDGGEGVGSMLIVHLLFNVCEAMGANAVNYACEAAAPKIEEITGGRVNLRILSNLADKQVARAEFRLPFKHLECKQFDGEQVARNIVESSRFAWVDPYRATTHNKGIFNGICAAAIALGQDWRAIEAGGHAYAARDGQYRALSSYEIEDGCLVGKIELPLQVGWVGGVVDSHPGVKILRKISGIQNSRELAALLAVVGLAQNFAACLALSTVGIQKGHMALHARNVALSIGVPPEEVDGVVREMVRRGEVKVAVAEEIYFKKESRPRSKPAVVEPVQAFASGKVVLFGEHATVYNYPGIASKIDIGLNVKIHTDHDGPRFITPEFKDVFQTPEDEKDIQLFSRATDVVLKRYGLQDEPIAIEIESDLVAGMGLGSSAAFSVGLCSALRRYKGLDEARQLNNGFFEDVQRLESVFHGNPSGIDAATVMSGGLLWFRKGPPREIVPIRIPSQVTGIVCIVEPGAHTIEIVSGVKENRERNPEKVDRILSQIGDLTVDAVIALGTGDTADAGRLMFRNHELLAELGVSTPGLDRAVELLRNRGALGAKLTGSGGGGAVVALVEPSRQHDMINKLSDDFPMVFPFTVEVSA
jgi:hydroxymethylglutaryl-CoA reductase